jgi:hypothetical protein
MLKNFKVIEVISSRSKALFTVYTNKIKFNYQTASELGYPEYVQFLINAQDMCFAIRACAKDAPNAVRFFNRPRDSKPYPMKYSNASIIDAVCNATNWHDDTKYYMVPGQLFRDEKTIVFNLKDADQHEVTTRSSNDDDDADTSNDEQ